MTTADALLAACLADPDADLPRLALADALDDVGDAGYAEFVRLQVMAAAAPAWEPLATHLRHSRPSYRTGEGFRGRLPATGNGHLEWAAEPFRRGLGWAVRVWQLADLLAAGDHLFEAAPVGELHLPTAPLADWQRLADRPWLAQLRTVRFTGLNLPVEPVRELGDSPGGVRELRFDQANHQGAGVLMGGLAGSPLGRQLTALHLRNGFPAAAEELVEELGSGGLRVGELSLQMVGLTEASARKLAAGPLLTSVHTLDLSHNQYLGSQGFQAAVPATGPARLQRLTLANVGLGRGAVRWLCWGEAFAGLRWLDLSDNRLLGDTLRPFARDGGPAGLRVLRLAHCHIADRGLRHLTAAACWPNLVELDLRFNGITDTGAKHLLAAPVPRELTALLLGGGNQTGAAMQQKLREKYGDAVRFDDEP